MSGEALADDFVHTCTVETWTGDGTFEDTWDPQVTVDCYIDDRIRQVRNADGEQVMSSTTIRTYLTHVDLFAPGSRVHIFDDPARTVIGLSRHSGGPDFTDIEYLEVVLT